MHTKYLINNKVAWILQGNSEFMEIEPMITKIYFYVTLTKNTNFQI